MAIDVITAVLELAATAVGPTERLVLYVLAWHANKHGFNVWPAVPTIAREASLTPRAVQKALRRLLTKGFLIVDSTRARRSVIYAINLTALDRERYSQSKHSDRELRSQSDTESDVFHSVDREPRSPIGEPRSREGEPRSQICEPRSPDPDLNRQEPSEKKCPDFDAPVDSDREPRSQSPKIKSWLRMEDQHGSPELYAGIAKLAIGRANHDRNDGLPNILRHFQAICSAQRVVFDDTAAGPAIDAALDAIEQAARAFMVTARHAGKSRAAGGGA